MDPRSGNRRSRAPSRSTGFAPTGTKKHAGRPAGRSVSRTRKAENARFRAGSRQGDGATRRSLMSARCGPNWLPSPTPRLTTGRFSKSSGPTNKRSTFFMHGEVSDRREQLEVPRRATTSAARSRYLRDKATTEPEVLRRELGFFRKHRCRLRKPQGQRLRAPASSANKVLVNQRMKRARWSIEGGVLTIVGRTVRHGDWGRERSAGRRLTVKSGSKNREFGKNRATPAANASGFLRPGPSSTRAAKAPRRSLRGTPKGTNGAARLT